MIDDDLREALRARASTYQTSPHAWIGVQRRLRTARRRRFAALAAASLSVAALAAGVPLVLSGTGSDHTTTRATTTAVPSKGHEDAFDLESRQSPPVGDPVILVNPADGRYLRLWFSRKPQQQGLDQPVPSDAPRYDVLCWAMQSALHGRTYAGCPVDADPRHAGQYAWYVGGTADDWSRGETVISYGVARSKVRKVSAIAADGTRLPGVIYRPKGAPAAVWAVTYPARARVRAFEFSDADGEVLGRTTPDPFLLSPTSAAPVTPPVDLPGGLTAQLHKDGTFTWLRDGVVVAATEILWTGATAGAPARIISWHFGHGRWFGLATAGTAKVELTAGTGAPIWAATARDPWRRGLALFSAPSGRESDLYTGGYTIVGFDARGKEIWREKVPPHPPLWTGVPLSTPAR
ncbi:hypothetical protein [Sphaerisporangium rhizosphaerae]|uniref:WD40 repeat domain-containing protein n=1 Tax=Sphaerisporangium rhizosphaerae TaxID=2269375 RepID=A0ABW2NXI5_9ACTN